MGEPSATPEDDDGVALGSVLDGRYRIDAVIGIGGMGRVYRGEHTGIGRAVAIKVLHADLGRNKEAAQRFQREALASGRLDHPNIVGVSDFGTIEHVGLYLVMESLEGEPLGDRLARERTIHWLEAIEIARYVLTGLRHAHDRGVVHRDIKPDNIFLARKDGDQIIKILDFGIAKLYAGSTEDPAMTRAGLTVGTPAYLSPEQAVGGSITPASDLYSMSIVLYEMLTGRAPFEDKDPLAMLTAHVSREAPAISDIAPDLKLPAGLEDVVRRGMAKMAAERTSSAIEYIAQLDAVVEAAGFARPNRDVREARGSRAMATATPSAAVPVETPVEPESNPRAQTAPVRGSVGESLSKKQLIVGGIVLVVALLFALILLAWRNGRAQQVTPADGSAAPVVGAPASTPSSDGERELRMKAALHDLEDSRSCTDKKAAIATLEELADPRAVPSLRARAKDACVRTEVEALLKKLTAPK